MDDLVFEHIIIISNAKNEGLVNSEIAYSLVDSKVQLYLNEIEIDKLKTLKIKSQM